ELEPLADRQLLGSGLRPPGPLEVQDRPLSVGECHPRQPALPGQEGQASQPGAAAPTLGGGPSSSTGKSTRLVSGRSRVRVSPRAPLLMSREERRPAPLSHTFQQVVHRLPQVVPRATNRNEPAVCGQTSPRYAVRPAGLPRR